MIRSILDVAYLKEVVENSTAVKLAAEHLAGAGDKNMHILVECNHVVVLGIVSKNCGAVIILAVSYTHLTLGSFWRVLSISAFARGLNIVPVKPLEITPVLGSQGSGLMSALRTIVIL